MDNNLFIEETPPNREYVVVWRGNNGMQDISEAFDQLQSHPSMNHLELWSKDHASSPKGFAPMAFRLKGGPTNVIKVSHTLMMLIRTPVNNTK